MTTLTAIKHRLPSLETKQVWSLFTRSYADYVKQPFTAKGEKNWNIFLEAKKELKNRKEGWW